MKYSYGVLNNYGNIPINKKEKEKEAKKVSLKLSVLFHSYSVQECTLCATYLQYACDKNLYRECKEKYAGIFHMFFSYMYIIQKCGNSMGLQAKVKAKNK